MLVETIAASLGSAMHRARLVAELEGAFTTTLAALTSTVEAKDDYTACHGEDVAEMTERVALRMALPSAQARDVRYAAMLHDIGKVAVPSEILLKPGPLTDEEWVRDARPRGVGGELVARIDGLRSPRAGRSREPRALGRRRLPRRSRRAGDPAGGAHHRRMRHLRRDRHRPALPPGAVAARGLRGAARVAGSQLDAAVVTALARGAAQRRRLTRSAARLAVVLRGRLAQALAAARDERRRDVAPVAPRVVAGQHERGERAQRVAPGGQPANERAPRRGEWCLRM